MRLTLLAVAGLALAACRTDSPSTPAEPITVSEPDQTEVAADEQDAPVEAGSSEDQLLTAAAEYAEQQSGMAMEATLEAIEGEFARVSVSPLGGEADPAVVYLRREGDAWMPLVIGTFFTPDDYAALGIPEALQDEPMP